MSAASTANDLFARFTKIGEERNVVAKERNYITKHFRMHAFGDAKSHRNLFLITVEGD